MLPQMGIAESTGISRIALISLVILLAEHVTTVTLMRYTQQRTNVPRPAPTVAVFFTEILKLVLSTSALLRLSRASRTPYTPKRSFSTTRDRHTCCRLQGH